MLRGAWRSTSFLNSKYLFCDGTPKGFAVAFQERGVNTAHINRSAMVKILEEFIDFKQQVLGMVDVDGEYFRELCLDYVNEQVMDQFEM